MRICKTKQLTKLLEPKEVDKIQAIYLINTTIISLSTINNDSNEMNDLIQM